MPATSDPETGFLRCTGFPASLRPATVPLLVEGSTSGGGLVMCRGLTAAKERGMPTKAAAAGGTALLAGALTTILLGALGHPVSEDMHGAIQTVITAVIAGLGAYLPKMEGGA